MKKYAIMAAVQDFLTACLGGAVGGWIVLMICR